MIDIPFVRQEGEPLTLQLRAFCRLVRGELDPDRVRDRLVAPHRAAHAVLAEADVTVA